MEGMKLSLAIALMVGLAVGMGRAVHAAVLFEQVPSAGGTAFISSPPVLLTGDPGYRQADSFQLSQDAVVRDLHWWGNKSEKYLNAGGSYTLVDDYNFTLTVYEDADGLPGVDVPPAAVEPGIHRETLDPLAEADLLAEADDVELRRFG